MTNKDKINAIEAIRGSLHREDEYYKLLEDMGDSKQNYRDYMTYKLYRRQVWTDIIC